MALFEYQRRQTLMHRLHPLSKAVWMISVGFVLSIYFDPRPLAIMLLMILPVVAIARLPWRSWFKPLAFVILIGMVSFLIISLWLTNPETYSRYPEWTSVVFLRITEPAFPLGQMALTLAGTAYALGQTLRSVIMVLIVAIFIYSTAPSDLVYLLDKARLPAKLVFIVMAAYRFFPHIFRKLSIVLAAQRLRGWEVKGGNPLTLAKQYLPIAIPVMTETVHIAEYTTMAIESRAFGSARFTLHHDLKLERRDLLFSGFWLMVVAAYLYAYFALDIGKL